MNINIGGCLTIIDPLNPRNNLAKNTYNFDKIKKEMENSHNRFLSLLENMEDVDPKKDYLSKRNY